MTRAATRDASWYRNPSTHGKDVAYHVVAPERGIGESACGTPLVVTEGFAPRRDVTVDAATVLPASRCQRPGCKARWPAVNALGVGVESPSDVFAGHADGRRKGPSMTIHTEKWKNKREPLE